MVLLEWVVGLWGSKCNFFFLLFYCYNVYVVVFNFLNRYSFVCNFIVYWVFVFCGGFFSVYLVRDYKIEKNIELYF